MKSEEQSDESDQSDPEQNNPQDVLLDDDSITISPGLQPGLDSLVDVGNNERPPYTNFTLIKYAILGSPNGRLTLSEIYDAITTRFPWFEGAGQSWKNSVRHCLSLDTQFERINRQMLEPGKGSFWTVNQNVARGNKRQRKRNKKPSKRALKAALQPPSVPSAFRLTTPAFRDPSLDYATTVPAPPDIQPVASSSTQSGWTPYFPPGMEFTPYPEHLRQDTVATNPKPQIPQMKKILSADICKLSPESRREEEMNSRARSSERQNLPIPSTSSANHFQISPGSCRKEGVNSNAGSSERRILPRSSTSSANHFQISPGSCRKEGVNSNAGSSERRILPRSSTSSANHFQLPPESRWEENDEVNSGLGSTERLILPTPSTPSANRFRLLPATRWEEASEENSDMGSPERQPPTPSTSSASRFKLRPAVRWEEEDDVDSDPESEEGLPD